MLAISRELRKGANHHMHPNVLQDASALCRLAPRIVLVRKEQFFTVFFGENAIPITIKCIKQLPLKCKQEEYSGKEGLGLLTQLVYGSRLGKELGPLKLQFIRKVHGTKNGPDIFRMVVKKVQVHEFQEVSLGDGIGRKCFVIMD